MPKLTNFTQQPNFPELEEQVLKFWEKDSTFVKSVEQRSADKSYVFYDGPPFATGMPHYGHLLASTTKDVIPRYWTMKGYRVERVWGWDCHGLPIENMIEGQLEIKGGKKGIEAMGIDKFNAACRTEVLRLDKEWEKIIGRLGRWVDFEHNYKTMDMTFMESVWWGFKQLAEKGLVYEGRKVILYCPRCSTPLSNFEIAMDNSYKEVNESGTTYKYPVKGEEKTFLLAWSTTPWNKLATPALAVNPVLQYVKVKQNGEFYILAETTLKMLKDEPYEVVAQYTGQDLEKFEFEPHFDFYPNRKAGEKFGVVVADPFVTAEEGTGIVTLAVYGEDDYRVMLQHGIQLIEHVDEEGRLKPEVTPWAGMDILKSNKLVNADLAERGLIYRDDPHTHSVATCYRCGTRLYYAPLPAWFISIQKLRQDLIAQNEHINWYPEHLKQGRFLKGLENAPDWNISRSRYWGTPMPIWREVLENGKLGDRYRVIGSVAELKEWAVNLKTVANLTDIHREFLDEIEVWVDEAKTIKGRRTPEVFDCWIESGSMPFAAVHYPFENKEKFEANYPAQFVSEYIAQTRAWFYTMHVMSVGIFGKPPFENVLTTGTILAEDGNKMSKSKKNYPDPMLLIDKYGVDSLRLYMMSSTVMKGENLNFSEREVSDIRRRVFVIWWNVLSFYMSFGDHSTGFAKPDFVPTSVMDTWLLSRLHHLIGQVTDYMDHYDVVRASRVLMEFVDELSTWYLRQSRDRLKSDHNQESSQVLGYTLYTLAQLFAPLAPFFPEMVHHSMSDETTSIHLTEWPSVDPELCHADLEEKMAEVQRAVEKTHAVRKEAGLKVRQPLPKVTVISKVEKPKDTVLEVMAQELNVKTVAWKKGEELMVELDTTITPELKAEGDARELMRSIQKLRKEAGLAVGQTATVEAPEWPVEWQAEIERKTFAQLVKGSELKLVTGA
jgi:isoleucyl-tRNA synthetase